MNLHWITCLMWLAAFSVAANSATIKWDAEGGDSLWHNPRNWENDVLPTDVDRVEIGQTGATIVVRNSVVVDSFNVASGITILVEGVGVSLESRGAVSVDGASFVASRGASILLPTLASYDLPEAEYFTAVFRADGFGSRIECSNLVTIIGSARYRTFLTIESLNGGLIKLPNLVDVNDPVNGHWDSGIVIVSDGFGSRVELPSLANFIDGGGLGGSELKALRGGAIASENLAHVQSVRVYADSATKLTLGQIRQMLNSTLFLSGGGVLMTNLTSATGTVITLDAVAAEFPELVSLARGGMDSRTGSVVSAPKVAQVDGASFSVGNGTTLSFPAVTQYDRPEVQSLRVTWKAEGIGSILDFPNLSNITGSGEYDSYMTIQSINGGAIRLPKVVSMTDSIGGHHQTGIILSCEGQGSVIDLSALVSFSDHTLPGASGLTALRGGVIQAPLLANLKGVQLNLDSIHSLQLYQLTQVLDGGMVLRGFSDQFAQLVSIAGTKLIVESGTLTFPALTTISGGSVFIRSGGSLVAPRISTFDGATLSVSDGGILSLAGVSGYDLPEIQNFKAYWKADGVGSRIELPNLLSINGSAQYDSYLTIHSVNGGAVIITNVINIVDPAESHNQTGIWVQSDGIGSLVDLASLVHFTDHSSLGDSRLEAVRGGRVNIPNLSGVKGVKILMDEAEAIQITQLRQIIGGTLHLQGLSLGLNQLVSLAGTRLVVERGLVTAASLSTIALGSLELVSGGRVDFGNLSNIDGASLVVADGSILKLPSVTRVDLPEIQSLRARWKAEGIGSTILLTNLASITGSQQYDSYHTIEASNGGLLDLSSVTIVSDPADGHHQSGIQVYVRGEGSRINFSKLENFSDHTLPGRSLIEVARGGNFHAPLLIALKGVTGVLDSNSTLPLPQLRTVLDCFVSIQGKSENLDSLVSLAGSRFRLESSHLNFPQLQNAQLASLELASGSRMELPRLSNIDGASLSVSDGSKLRLPLVVSVNLPEIGNRHVYWVANGVGSELELPLLQTITGSAQHNSYHFIQAVNGGQIFLPLLTDMIDPVAGSWHTGIQLLSQGFGSVLTMRSLAHFYDHSSTDQSRWVATQQGAIEAPSTVAMIGVPTQIDNGGIWVYPRDADTDGLSDLSEFLRGTNPAVADSDGDGVNDFAEIESGSNPLDPLSKPESQTPTDQRRYHSADYRSAFWVMDGTEVNRVLAYWRTGAYHTDPLGFDGYASGVGAITGVRHSADYREPLGIIDASEANRVLSYWRAKAYHPDIAGLDGFAAGPAIGVQSVGISSQVLANKYKSQVQITQSVKGVDKASGRLRVQVRVKYVQVPLGMVVSTVSNGSGPVRKIQSAAGDGQPDLVRGEILFTGNLPQNESEFEYSLEPEPALLNLVPEDLRFELLFPGLANGLEISAAGTLSDSTTTPENQFRLRLIPSLFGSSLTQFRLEIQGSGDWILEVSRDFRTWQDTVLEGSGSSVLELPIGNAGTPQEFYRAKKKSSSVLTTK